MRFRSIQAFSLPIGLMVLIFVLSSIPGSMGNQQWAFLTDIDPQLQNLLHIPLFGLLQFLWLRGFRMIGYHGRRAVLICLAISFAYGVLDELHQLTVPGRYASLMDIGLNAVGVALGTLLFLWMCGKYSKSVS